MELLSFTALVAIFGVIGAKYYQSVSLVSWLGFGGSPSSPTTEVKVEVVDFLSKEGVKECNHFVDDGVMDKFRNWHLTEKPIIDGLRQVPIQGASPSSTGRLDLFSSTKGSSAAPSSTPRKTATAPSTAKMNPSRTSSVTEPPPAQEEETGGDDEFRTIDFPIDKQYTKPPQNRIEEMKLSAATAANDAFKIFLESSWTMVKETDDLLIKKTKIDGEWVYLTTMIVNKTDKRHLINMMYHRFEHQPNWNPLIEKSIVLMSIGDGLDIVYRSSSIKLGKWIPEFHLECICLRKIVKRNGYTAIATSIYPANLKKSYSGLQGYIYMDPRPSACFMSTNAKDDKRLDFSCLFNVPIPSYVLYFIKNQFEESFVGSTGIFHGRFMAEIQSLREKAKKMTP